MQQRHAAKLLGVSPAYLSSIERGHESPPGQRFVDKLAKVLELSEDELEELALAASRSQRHFTIQSTISVDHLEMVNVLIDRLPMLNLGDVRRIKKMIETAGESQAR